MGALLINDLRNEQSAANPKTPLRNPMNLFTENSFHGGAWRIGWKFGCIGTPSVVGYLTSAYVVTGYLVLYNLLQTIGWAAALLLFLKHVQSGSSSTLWSVVGSIVFNCTMATFLEVGHSLVGAVRAPVGSTAIQVISRVALAQIINFAPGAQNVRPWLYMMIFAWSLTETIRYLFYGLNLLNMQVPVLTWLRYSLFIVLYPLGVAGEIGVLASVIPKGLLASATNPSSPFLMRTVFGPLFQGIPFWLFVVAAYGPGLFFLYGHMLKQRQKVLKQKAE
jgi:very-long-chain (3R)-3-hydroxyacyl-CoA dehydratase